MIALLLSLIISHVWRILFFPTVYTYMMVFSFPVIFTCDRAFRFCHIYIYILIYLLDFLISLFDLVVLIFLSSSMGLSIAWIFPFMLSPYIYSRSVVVRGRDTEINTSGIEVSQKVCQFCRTLQSFLANIRYYERVE